MLSLIVGLACFFGGIYFLKNKMNFNDEIIMGLLAGLSFFTAVSGISQIIVGVFTLNATLIIGGLLIALLNGFFANYFAKRGGLID